MKKLLIPLFSLFLLSSPSVFADDISDFEIEGISIGDSLLDYMTEDEILDEIERNKGHYLNLKEPEKYAEVIVFKDKSVYQNISVKVKNNSSNKYVSKKNEKYEILSIRGQIFYNNNFEGCITKRDEIAEILSGMFPNSQKNEYFYTSSVEPSGKSHIDQIDFEYASGDKATIYCSDYEETWRIKGNFDEGINVSIKLKEISSWLSNY